jgi:hypothetical protein
MTPTAATGWALALLAALALQMPLRWLLPPELAAQAVAGTPWHGQLRGAQWNGVALGEVTSRLALPGPGRLWLAVSGDHVQARLGRGPGQLLAEAVQADVTLPIPGLGLARLHLQDAAAAMDAQGRCHAASGQVALDLPLPGGGDTLAGPLSCASGQWQAALASRQGPLQLRVAADASQAQVSVSGADAGLAARLAGIGFRDQGGAMAITVQRAP